MGLGGGGGGLESQKKTRQNRVNDSCFLPGYSTARMAWLTSKGSFTAFLFQELNALIIFLN